jgi:superfamily II DNA or RNA helicase
MIQVSIGIQDPVNAVVSNEDARFIIEPLSFEAEYYRPRKIPGTEKIIKQRFTYNKSLLQPWGKSHRTFPAGLVDRVINFCEGKGIQWSIAPLAIDIPQQVPRLKGITLREDQNDVLDKVLQGISPKGIIKAPTGMGKTIIQLAICSVYRASKTLLLTHRTDIVAQTVEKAKELGLKGVIQKGAGKKEKMEEDTRLVVSTIQTFARIMEKRVETNLFDVVIVDEAHHVAKFESQYGEVLSKVKAPVRLGFTATLPESLEAQFAMEGLIGPVIAEVSYSEMIEADIIVKPEIRFLRSPFSQRLKDIRKYQDVYAEAIVANSDRNYLIATTALKHIEKNEAVLIFVNEIQHGNYLQELFDGEVPFVQGSMPPEERMRVKKGLINKSIFLVIATTAWKEGVDIPNLDVVILAAGGKTEIPVIQSIGRGLRRTKTKTKAIIYDIFDPSSNYLISHFGERVSMYFELGLMGGE